jgi:hypothetical protein
VYHTPPFFIREDSQTRNAIAEPGVDRASFLGRLPEGDLREQFAEVLEKEELSFRETICSFLDEFAPCLFEYTRDFWKTFVSGLAEILNCEKSDVLAAIDEAIVNVWYLPPEEDDPDPIPGLVVGDAITPNIEAEPLPRMDRFPEDVPLSLTEDGRVIVERDVEHGGFICDVPGLLCHEDEIDASKGIPRSAINVAGTQIIIDVSRSTNQLLKRIRRSFHYNCLTRIVRVAGKVRVGLYATGMKGPMLEDKAPRGISEDSELLLSMDADLPYAVEKPFWKLKKPKPPGKTRSGKTRIPRPPAKPAIETKSRSKKTEVVEAETRTMKTRSTTDFPFALTLLSAFCEDACPPIPLILKDKREMQEVVQNGGGLRRRLRIGRPCPGGDSYRRKLNGDDVFFTGFPKSRVCVHNLAVRRCEESFAPPQREPPSRD